jgi:hypothetical protein
MEKNLFKKAYKLWENFKSEILFNNRFILKHEVLDYIKHFVEKNKIYIEKGTILYRARIFTDDSGFINGINNIENLDKFSQYIYQQKAESGFWGYGEIESFVPPNNDKVGNGRVNPAFIKYLYTSENPYTAMVEVRPYFGSKVSIADIIIEDSVCITDFSRFYNVDDEFEVYLIHQIMNDFSKPSDSDIKDYLPTQYIAEFIKSLGVHGVRFNSSLHSSGKNITFFKYDKCKPISSKLYEIKDICYGAKSLAPYQYEFLEHEKLHPYRNKVFQEFTQELKEQNKK